MARSNAQPIRGALDFLDLRHVFDVPANFVDLWSGTKRPSDLLRDALEIRSDYSFVSEVSADLDGQLAALGVQPTAATAMVAEVLCRPGFSSARLDKGLAHIRHAVLFARDDERALSCEVLVDLKVTVRPWHADAAGNRSPANVTSWTLSSTLFDREADSDLGAVLTHHAAMLREFPASRTPTRATVGTVAILGDPKELSVAEAPDDWRAQLELLCLSFGLAASFHQHPTYTGTLADRVRRVIRFEPFTGKDPVTDGGVSIPHTGVDARQLEWPALFHQVAVGVAETTEPAPEDEYAPRVLRAGERVYHRKRGNSRAFDSFDKGSSSPCIHTGQFITWTKSPKAAAGMLRRYPNFQTSWLRHCARGMNCGMYAVFAPASL